MLQLSKKIKYFSNSDYILVLCSIWLKADLVLYVFYKYIVVYITSSLIRTKSSLIKHSVWTNFRFGLVVQSNQEFGQKFDFSNSVHLNGTRFEFPQRQFLYISPFDDSNLSERLREFVHFVPLYISTLLTLPRKNNTILVWNVQKMDN